jgi:hypothetical protein
MEMKHKWIETRRQVQPGVLLVVSDCARCGLRRIERFFCDHNSLLFTRGGRRLGCFESLECLEVRA